jgi:hypothetical protein
LSTKQKTKKKNMRAEETGVKMWSWTTFWRLLHYTEVLKSDHHYTEDFLISQKIHFYDKQNEVQTQVLKHFLINTDRNSSI